MTTRGVLAGLAVGISMAAFLTLTGRDPYRGLNAGFIALIFNFAVTALVSLGTRVEADGFDDAGSAAIVSA